MKHKKFRKSIKDFDPVRYVENGQLFGKIMVNNGNNFLVKCSDGLSRFGRICNAMRKGPKLGIHTFVVVTLREYESVKRNCDIIAYANPPHHIVVLFEDGKNYNSDIVFVEEQDEYAEFTDLPDPNASIEDKLDWLDL